MLSQSERDFQRKFVGNVALFLDIDRYRQRTVLQRNVKAALLNLLHHKSSGKLRGPRSELAASPRDASAMTNDSEALKCIDVTRKRQVGVSKWHADGMLAQAASLPEAALKLELKSLKRKNSRSQRALSLNGEPPTKRMRGLGVRCHCDVSIFENEKTVVRKSEQCTLQRVDSEKESSAQFRIDLDNPMIILAKELIVDVEYGEVSIMTVAESYTVQVSLRAIHSEDLWPPIPTKDGISYIPTIKSAVSGKRSSRPAVVCKWYDLPKCPPDDRLLDASIIKDGKKYETEYGIAIEASWNEFESALEKLNAEIRNSAAARFPTPISEPDTPKDVVRTTYRFGESRSNQETSTSKTIVTMGYLCPLCRNRDFGCLYLLHFHLLSCHSLFKFQVKRDEKKGPTGLEADVTIEVDVADQYFERASNHVKDERDIMWVRSDEPFDLAAYLAGDERWVGGSDARSIALGSFRTYKTPASTIASAAAPSTRTSGPREVPDLLPPKRKKHVVPPTPAGIAFFRTTAKRRLIEGESVSESDDDVDEAWLYHKHDEIIDDFTDITLAEKEFVKRYDEQMLRERLNGNEYLPDALIRFCRANRGWLKRPVMKTEFCKLVAKLRLQGVVSDLVAMSCQESIQKAVSESDKTLLDDVNDVDMDGHSHSEKIHGNESARDFARQDTVEGSCTCGLKVTNMKGSIICASIVSHQAATLYPIFQCRYEYGNG